MKFSELIGHSITCIKTFNPVVTTIDSHADEFIARVSESLPPIDIPLTFYPLAISSRTPTRRSSSNKSSTAARAIKTFSR